MSDGFGKEILAVLGRIEGRLGALETRLDTVETRLDSLNARVGAIAARQDEIEARNAGRHAELMGHLRRVEAKVDRLEVRVDRVHDDMSDAKVRLTQIDSTIVNWAGTVAIQSGRQDRFEMIEKRLELRDGRPPS